ncbi:MAG: hypothetical protein KQJ78_01670 [Deltaproteobacteria bacterium]|nr:hypothetical protein [Deltaproteobacteria bacterium]
MNTIGSLHNTIGHMAQRHLLQAKVNSLRLDTHQDIMAQSAAQKNRLAQQKTLLENMAGNAPVVVSSRV